MRVPTSLCARVCRDHDGITALHLTALTGSVDALCALVTLGADVNSVARDGRTPLHQAAAMGQDEVVNLLVGVRLEKTS